MDYREARDLVEAVQAMSEAVRSQTRVLEKLVGMFELIQVESGEHLFDLAEIMASHKNLKGDADGEW